MFVKKNVRKIKKEDITVSQKINKCVSCGKPFVPECVDGVCPAICPECQQKSETE